MDRDDLTELLQSEVRGLNRYLTTVDYENAADDASRETAWAFPVSSGFRTYWIKQRAKRHLFFYLMSESAHKFKYEQINLQHRFDHYSKVIEYMDTQFGLAIEEHPDEFTDLLGYGDDVVGIMGTQIAAGFRYSPAGRDITYEEKSIVDFYPKRNE